MLSIIEYSSLDGPTHIGISSKEKRAEFYLGAGLEEGERLEGLTGI
jgi:hypothetical protein